MKKRGILTTFSIIFLLILMPNAFSIYEELVYSGTVDSGDTVEIENKLFEFNIDPVSNKVSVQINVSGIIVASGRCEIKDNFDVCIKNISFSYRNLTDYRDIYKAEVNIYQIKSKIDVTHTIGKSNILIGEETTVELTIENTADVAAEDVLATIKLPSSILATDLEGCKKTFDSIVFNEDVHPAQIKKCTYKIRGLVGGDFELATNVTYFNGIETVSATVKTIDGGVYNHSLKISSKLNESKFNIGKKLNLTIKIENINDEHDLKITSFKIKIPQDLLLIKKPKDTIRNDRILSWSGSLAANDHKNFLIQLQSKRTGNHSVIAEASYKVSKFLRSAKSKSIVEVYCDCPYILYDLSEQITMPEQKTGLRAFIVNPGKTQDFKNVKINYNTNIPDIPDFSVTYRDIKHLQSIRIFGSPFIGPNADEIYHFNITATYESEDGQIFVQKANIEIKVPDEKETTIEGQQESGEREEVIETGLVEEKIEEEIEESDEEEIDSEETPVTTVEFKEEKSFVTYIVITIIASLVFILIIFIILKRKSKLKIKTKDAWIQVSGTDSVGLKKEIPEKIIETKKRRSIKEILHLDLLKKEHLSKKPEGEWEEDEGYRELERQVNKLGITPESENQTKNKNTNARR